MPDPPTATGSTLLRIWAPHRINGEIAPILQRGPDGPRCFSGLEEFIMHCIQTINFNPLGSGFRWKSLQVESQKFRMTSVDPVSIRPEVPAIYT